MAVVGPCDPIAEAAVWVRLVVEAAQRFDLSLAPADWQVSTRSR